MTDFPTLLAPDRGQPACAIIRVTKKGFDDWLKTQPARARTAVSAARFEGKPDSHAFLPSDPGDSWSVVIGIHEEAHDPWQLSGIAARLPEGIYRLAEGSPEEAALGWLLAQHRFDRDCEAPEPARPRVLLTPDPARIDEMVALARAPRWCAIWSRHRPATWGRSEFRGHNIKLALVEPTLHGDRS